MSRNAFDQTPEGDDLIVDPELEIDLGYLDAPAPGQGSEQASLDLGATLEYEVLLKSLERKQFTHGFSATRAEQIRSLQAAIKKLSTEEG